MRRWLKVTLVVLVVLIVLPALVLSWVVATESGTRFAFDRAAPMLPDGIAIGAVEGRLRDRVVLHDIAVDDEGMRLRLDRAELRWTSGALMRGRLVIHELTASGLHVELLPTEPEVDPEPVDPFELPERIRHYVAVELERVALRDAVIIPAPDADPIEIDEVLLVANLRDAQLAVERISVASPLLSLEGKATLSLAGDYPIAADLDWTARLPDLPEVNAATGIDGSLVELNLEQRVAAPYNLELSALLTDLVRTAGRDADATPHIAATARVQRLETAAIDPEMMAMTVSLDARVEGPFDALGVDLDARVDDIDQGRIDARLSAVVGPEAVDLRELVITQPTHDGRLEAAGRVSFADDFVADVTMTWDRLQWPLDDTPDVRIERGQVAFTGSADDYRLEVSTALDLPELPRVALELSGRGDMEKIAFDLAARTDAGNVTGQANLSWKPEVTGRIELAGEDIDPAVLREDLPGRIGFTLRADAALDGNTLRAELHEFDVAGTLRDEVLAMRARGRFSQVTDGDEAQPQVVALDLFELALGQTRASAEGRMDEAVDLRFDVDAPDLGELYAELKGRLAGSGTVTGTLPRPRVTADLAGSEFEFEGYTLAEFVLDADLDLAGSAASALTLRLEGGDLDGILLERLELEGSGRPDDHRLELVLRSSEGAMDVGLDGRLEEPADADPLWHFSMTEARLEYPELAPWELIDAANGHVGVDRVSVSRHCWGSGDARLCLGADQTPDALDVAFELTDLGFDYFASLLPSGYSISGALSASGSVSQRGDGPFVGDVDLRTTAGDIVLEAADPREADDLRLRLEPSHARLALAPEAAKAEVALILEHGHLRLDARLADPGNDTAFADRPLEGAFDLDIPDLAFVSEFLPDLSDVRGSVLGNLEFGGTLESPALMGALTVEEGQVRLPDIGILLADIGLEVRGDGGDSLDIAARAVSGDGSIDISGEVSPFLDVPTANLRIEGADFEAVNMRDARATISPDLVVTVGAGRIDIDGEVLIPFADITPEEVPAGSVRASTDQVLLEEDTDEVRPEAVAQALHARVRLRLGDDVRFDGFGLTARFEGNLQIVERPERPTTGTGELRILDGEYQAYGQGLVIDSGRIFWAGGPLTEPGVDLRAVRRPRDDILVGANVRGTLEAPEFTLFSEPPMVQQEQLSWLVLGRSLQEAPAGEQSALSQAALTLGVRGGDFLARNIGDRLGIDQLAIETGTGEAGAPADPSQAALVAGLYVTPRIFVSYGIGLFDPVNVFRIRYTITSNLELVTESSSESTGADIIYTFERGR